MQHFINNTALICEGGGMRAAVTGGIGDVKVVVAAAGGKHIVLLQQLHGLGGGGGAVHTSMAEVSRLKS